MSRVVESLYSIAGATVLTEMAADKPMAIDFGNRFTPKDLASAIISASSDEGDRKLRRVLGLISELEDDFEADTSNNIDEIPLEVIVKHYMKYYTEAKDRVETLRTMTGYRNTKNLNKIAKALELYRQLIEG